MSLCEMLLLSVHLTTCLDVSANHQLFMRKGSDWLSSDKLCSSKQVKI